MYKLIRITLFIIVISVFAVIFSCTKLDEEIYSTTIPENFYKTEEEIVSILAPVYGELRTIISGRGITDLEDICTDIMVVPTRNYGGWFDGGVFQRLHEHTWTSEHPHINNIWKRAFSLINRSNMVIYQLEQQGDNINPEKKDRFLSELYIIRALGYYYLLNAFGNVPIVDRFDVPEDFKPVNNSDFQIGRNQVFEFIENDLLNNISKLDDNVNESTYGRFNKWATMTILVKLYMNAEIWTGNERWDDAITYANQIIQSGKYQLEDNYFSNFLKNNNSSSENIFVLPYHPTLTGKGMRNKGYVHHQHFSAGPVVGAPMGGWNGYVAIPSFIRSFHFDDRRLDGWAIGPQIDKNTGKVVLNTRASQEPLVYTIDFENIYFEGDPTEYNYALATEYNGARFFKYEVSFESGTNMSNDWVVFRLADILLLKAEALMRKNGGIATAEAVNLVNQVRSRAFDNSSSQLFTLGTLSLDELLAERAREFYYEGMRRNDLIRFGKFARGEWEWYDRSNHGDNKNWFPIPQVQINANNLLVQNPGY